MITRNLEATIIESLQNFPIVGLIGSRQVGKTTLAKSIAQSSASPVIFLDLERPGDLVKLTEPEIYLDQHADKLIIIDEIQRQPDLFPLLRSLVDDSEKKGRFLILGSATPKLIRQSSESLAGRIIYHELFPITFEELGGTQKTFSKHWLLGGYPNSLLAKTNQHAYQWMDAFMRSYLEMDLPQLGYRVSSTTLRRFWMMLAHSHGQLWNASQLAGSLGVSPPSVRHYLDILHDTFIIRACLKNSCPTAKASSWCGFSRNFCQICEIFSSNFQKTSLTLKLFRYGNNFKTGS